VRKRAAVRRRCAALGGCPFVILALALLQESDLATMVISGATTLQWGGSNELRHAAALAT
jgi:hypothetical protein